MAARQWIKWRACDVGKAKEGLGNELWRRWSNVRVGEWAVGKATEELGNELWRRWSDGKFGEWAELHFCIMSRAHSPTFPSLHLRHNWISSPSVALPTSPTNEQSSFYFSVTSPTSQLILQPFRRFTYVTVHFPTLPLLHLRHSSFSNPSFASPTSQALHLASRPWCAHNELLTYSDEIVIFHIMKDLHL